QGTIKQAEKPAQKLEVYTYNIDEVATQRNKNELKPKDRLSRGWIRFTMKIDRIHCEHDANCYAVSKEGRMGFIFAQRYIARTIQS
ncbi:hypothetical protein, partial [Yersinia entomophaga]|uniref:hypothetical protein n=1 Tax=Yersinia entomophaga TaxID=935293 RepID=UPI0039EF4F07